MGDYTGQLRDLMRSGAGEIDSVESNSNVIPFPTDVTPAQERIEGAIGTGGNATKQIEDVERDTAGAVPSIDSNVVRKSIGDTDGELALAKHDIGILADKVMEVAGVVTPSTVVRSRTHGKMPKKPAKPNARKGTPADTGLQVDFTKLDKSVVFRKPV